MTQDVAVGDTATAKSLEARIESMFATDRVWALGVVVALWLTIFFVMLSVRGMIHDAAIETTCWIGAVVLLLFNTASIIAMIRHYGEDKAHIYGVDIRHLDAGR